MSTIGERIKIVQVKSGLQQPQFAQSLGISKETLIHYQKGRRYPNSVFLYNLCKVYSINPAWLLLGEGETGRGDAERGGILREEKITDIDPILQILNEEVERAGITLTSDQHTAILKILRELVHRDVRSIQELLRSMPSEEKKGVE